MFNNDINYKCGFLDIKLKKLIPNSFKSIIAKILINNFFGKIIRFFNPKNTLNSGVFDFKNVSDKEAAQIFFGLWESTEIRFALKFIQSKTIIELGSSVGVLFGNLAKKLLLTMLLETTKKTLFERYLD